MSRCFDNIAQEHELAAQRLGQDLAPVVREELKQVERILAQSRASAGPSGSALHGGCSEAQLDELARSVQVEVVQPLHEQIKSLSQQVRTLREELRRLKQRWTAERLAHITRGSANSGSPSRCSRYS